MTKYAVNKTAITADGLILGIIDQPKTAQLVVALLNGQEEIRGALESARKDLQLWHDEAMSWFDSDGVQVKVKCCGCDTCIVAIPAINKALNIIDGGAAE